MSPLFDGSLATKTDIARIEAEIANFEARIEEVKVNLLKWLIGVLIAQGGLIVALIKLF